jgi:hypothetical protein
VKNATATRITLALFVAGLLVVGGLGMGLERTTIAIGLLAVWALVFEGLWRVWREASKLKDKERMK